MKVQEAPMSTQSQLHAEQSQALNLHVTTHRVELALLLYQNPCYVH